MIRKKILEDSIFSPDYFNSYFDKNNHETDCFLTPESVVKQINESILQHKQIYLQAEHRSITFIN